MLVNHAYYEASHTVEFTIQSEDSAAFVYRTSRRCTTMQERSFRLLLPDCIPSFAAVHNDVWALVVLLVVFPFVRGELKLSFGVSRAFSMAYSDACGKRIYPVVPTLEPPKKAGGAPSVAFNGRMHSFMTAAVLGSSARLVAIDHWDRITGERTTPYPPDVLYYALDNMEHQGHRVCLVKTDIQSLYEPYGFAHPITSVVGNVLLMDVWGLGSVHVGCRLDDLSAYGAYTREKTASLRAHTQNAKVSVDGALSVPSRAVSFRDAHLWVDSNSPPEHTVSFWRAMLGHVGLQLEFPLCGVNDSLLVKLLVEHNMWHEANFCLYSRPRKRCGECVECMYYNTLHASVTTHSININKIWQQFINHYPEATTSVRDIDVPCRWNVFWLELIRRPDMTPPHAKGFDVLSAYHNVYHKRRWMVNSMKHIVLEEHYDKIRGGLSRIMGMLRIAR